MGATVSICNLTNVILNVALLQIGPLYFQNKVLPGDCVDFKTGRVWFTVEVKVWKNGTNNYNNAQRGLPIAAMSLGVPSVAGTAALWGSVIASNQRRSKQTDQLNNTIVSSGKVASTPYGLLGAVSAFNLVPAGLGAAAIAVNVGEKPIPRLYSSKKGVYINKERVRIDITGGPQMNTVVMLKSSDGQISGQTFDSFRTFPSLSIVVNK